MQLVLAGLVLLDQQPDPAHHIAASCWYGQNKGGSPEQASAEERKAAERTLLSSSSRDLCNGLNSF